MLYGLNLRGFGCTGVKNIHAYSWLAHSRKYLEAMASEKAANAAQKVWSWQPVSYLLVLLT